MRISRVWKAGIGEHLALDVGDLLAQQRLYLRAQIPWRRRAEDELDDGGSDGRSANLRTHRHPRSAATATSIANLTGAISSGQESCRACGKLLYGRHIGNLSLSADAASRRLKEAKPLGQPRGFAIQATAISERARSQRIRSARSQ